MSGNDFDCFYSVNSMGYGHILIANIKLYTITNPCGNWFFIGGFGINIFETGD
jgi:hypothetical protein